MTRLSKGDVISVVAKTCGLTGVKAKDVVDTVFDMIATRVNQGDEVVIKGFGAFELRQRAAREGRNPRTGEPVQIAATSVMGFRPAKSKS